MSKRKRSAGRHTITPRRSSFGIDDPKDLLGSAAILAYLYSRGKLRGLSSGPAHEIIFALALNLVKSNRVEISPGIGTEDLVIKTGIPLRTVHRALDGLLDDTKLVKIVAGNAGQRGSLFTLDRICLPDAGRNY